MAIAVLISSVALLLTAFASVGTFLAVRKLQSQVSPLLPQVAEFLVNSREALDEALKQFHETGEKTQSVLDDVRAEVASFSEARTEITNRLQAQVQRVELVLDESLSNIQEIVSVVHGGVIKPVREVTGFVSGVRTAVRSFFGKRRPSVEQATQDEEIFIG